ncbi:NIPSNAP family protein [Trinickia fusca]|uniref:NIPSNAP family protein n=1 Tax=Trinickia fusca TaxID=2419777 RepID=A0A494XCG7_9BURK|nr:NIPSNAP family protein [Trinickia fusca]RKP45243.1 NIPSNAP family protein [Trinickia fusca]
MNESIHGKQLEVVELRQYTLHPHKRDVLIDLFDRELVETQESVGMTVMGQFRDLDHPDLFVWLRGFESMETRLSGLTDFYGGPTWQTHRNAANATMIDSDNVLLLRPAWEGAHLPIDLTRRAGQDAVAIPPGFVDITIFYLNEPASAQFLAFCRERMQSVLDAGGAAAQGWYVTEPRENNFPRLPVRANEQVLMGIAVFPDLARFDEFGRSNLWAREVAPQLAHWPVRLTETHRLVPTARSATHA